MSYSRKDLLGNKPEPDFRGSTSAWSLLLAVFCLFTNGSSARVAAQTAPNPPVIVTQPASQTVVANENATFGVTMAGSGPFSYQWLLNGTNLPTISVINTRAGNGSSGFSGDGGQAVDAALGQPQGVAVDGTGNLYFSDSEHSRVRKVGTNGVVSTVAGNGRAGFSGDGGAATAASLSFPSGVAADGSGNLFIVDELNQRVRKVGANGVITTVAGLGNPGFSGDGGPAARAGLNFPRGVAVDGSGNLYIADASNNRVRRVDTNGMITTVAGNGIAGFSGDGGPAAQASLADPAGVAVDLAGNVYITDTGNNRVRQISPNGVIATVAGSGVAGFSGDGGAATKAELAEPLGVAVDNAGSLFVADTDNNRIRKVGRTGVITTMAGNGGQGYAGDGGEAAKASLWWPAAACVDDYGILHIADSYNNRIRDAASGMAETLTVSNAGPGVAGEYGVVAANLSGSATSAVATLTIVFPPAITIGPASQLAVLGGSASLSVKASGTPPLAFAWYANSTNLVRSGATPGLTFNQVTLDDAAEYTVVVINAYGSATSDVASLRIAFPPSIASQPANRTTTPGADVTFSVTPQGTGPFSYQWLRNDVPLPLNPVITTVVGNGTLDDFGDGGPAVHAALQSPTDANMDAAGNLYIPEPYNNRVRKVDAKGVITTVAGSGTNGFAGDGGPAVAAMMSYPSGIAADSSGNLYIADADNNRVRKVDPNGVITTTAGGGGGLLGDGGPAVAAGLDQPRYVAADTRGNLYISDKFNNRVRKVDPNGVITTVAGSGSGGFAGDGGPAATASLTQPYGLAIDIFGNLYIADHGNNRVRRVDSAGVITTVAGAGAASYSGDNGPAVGAALAEPSGVVLDASGNLYIADQGNNRIRRVDTNGVITTIAGNGKAKFAGDGGEATNASLNSPAGVTMDAAGNIYIADQNNNRIRKAALGVSPVLALTNVSAAVAGSYSVIVSSLFGSVTSRVAVLTVVLAPILQATLSHGDTLELQLAGAAGQTYVLESAPSLLAPIQWKAVFTNATDTNGNWTFTNAGLPAQGSVFYRVAAP